VTTPYEYRHREIPDEVELCGRCMGGIVFRRGPAQQPCCVRCGSEAGGPRYRLILAPRVRRLRADPVRLT
jgi:hypothetical protein